MQNRFFNIKPLVFLEFISILNNAFNFGALMNTYYFYINFVDVFFNF